MSKANIGAVVVAAILVLGGTAAATTATATDATPPPPAAPSWVNSDGTVDQSKVPEKLPVIGADGEPMKDENGKQVMVDSDMKPSEKSLRSTLPGEKHTVEKDEKGNTIENVEVKPTSPAAP